MSFRPVGYISNLTKERAKTLEKDRTSAWERPDDILEESVADWVESKFKSEVKTAMRDGMWTELGLLLRSWCRAKRSGRQRRSPFLRRIASSIRAA